MPTYVSTIHGNLKVKDQMLNFGEEIKLTKEEVSNDDQLRQLTISKQLVKKIK